VRSIAFLLLSVILGIFSCTTSTQTNDTILSGKVFYLDANKLAVPVSGALIQAKTFFAQTSTDASGSYQLTVDLSEDEQSIQLIASKVGFEPKEVVLLAKKGELVRVQDITLSKIQGDTIQAPTDTVTSSGDAAHIHVVSIFDEHIYISGVGLKETTPINFLVTDSKGVPVDEIHKTTVHFEILNGPGGGEYLFPETMETQNGYAYTILNSGIVAGAVQIQAWLEVKGQVIRTTPIRIAIYGGLPDADHFSVSMEKVNIAGRVHFGIIDNITAFVGDKYSNPVAPGTSVYFSTDYGIVEGAAVTDEMGRATVRFISALPLPPDPVNNPFAIITAHTFSDTLGKKTITTQTDVLLSAETAPIEISPTTFQYNDTNTPVYFNYKVHDVYGYPIVGGSAISVSATDGTLYGDVNIQMLDTQVSGPGRTEFAFTWAPGDSLEAPEVYISITVKTPADGNGYMSTSISGSKTSN